MFTSEFYESFKNTFFYRTPPVGASVQYKNCLFYHYHPLHNIFFFFKHHTLHKKWSFPVRISSANVTKSAGNFHAVIVAILIRVYRSREYYNINIHVFALYKHCPSITITFFYYNKLLSWNSMEYLHASVLECKD